MDPFKHFRSFRAKLISLVLLTSLLAAALVGGTLVTRNHVRLTEMAFQHLSAEADLIATQASYPLWQNDVEAAIRKLEALTAVPQIGAAYVYDNDGNIFASFKRPHDELPDLQPGFGRTITEGWLVLGGMPIEYEGVQVGSLEMAYDLQPIVARLWWSIAVGAGLGLLATFAALAVSLRLQRAVAKPIKALAETAEHIARTRDYSLRARRYGDDELGRLTSVFNSMLSEIERANRERAELLDRERDARDAAERATRVKDEFVATLSHELRTPLTAILGWAQLLRKPGGVANENIDEALATIERNARLQMQMVDDLLDMSRIISGKMRLDVQLTQLAEVIDAAIATVEPAAMAKRIGLERSIQPGIRHVLGDAARLQQVVWNLLSNAVKFTDPGGRVSVSLMQTGEHAVIEVTDTGKGIEPQFLPHVFDRFSQADDADVRKHNGLGLGLSIVKQVTELHGGTARVTSEGAGRGCRFTIRLPLADSRRQDAAATESLARVGPGNEHQPPLAAG